MGRKAVIDREKLLDIAEALVRAEGAAALTIGGLAAAAGISKGGVQYSFSSKDELVRGLVERWTAQFDRLMEGEGDHSPLTFIRRYLLASRQSGTLIDAKIAAVMMGYLRDPENLRASREWYQGILSRLRGPGEEVRRARVAFLALEGLFLMRVNGLDGEMAWESFLADIEAVLIPGRAGPGAAGEGDPPAPAV